MHGHSSERPGMEDNAEAEQPSKGRGDAGLLRRSRSAARHHRSSPLQGFGGSGRAVADFDGLQAWELISKSAEIRAEFRKTNSFYPH